ncbi:unnamed protein product [Kuraishia capsulata CBS 1993]|uniref:Uncharacterized protein n=1 Tax=Kuraishia capsulata CBS 1993 TaxID=1382522 RepID=W6MN57_9ASCO|nr:uncharacterized protein KUCA_T00002439001 [Kuraishia capsulata CBS 1993]CDK26467.1 unnamed protein product [Kuraishia capsulata CBS 1993]
MSKAPTYNGYIASSYDALLVIQATLNDGLSAVMRRPKSKDRTAMIESGNVFVFIEERSKIKRWTDGISWSPSRILGKFLLYREIIPNKNTKLRKNSYNGVNPGKEDKQGHTPTFVFKEKGLVKKTMTLSMTTKSNTVETIHLICYYSTEDVVNGTLVKPSETELKSINIDNDLIKAWQDCSLGGKVQQDFDYKSVGVPSDKLFLQPPSSYRYEPHSIPNISNSSGLLALNYPTHPSVQRSQSLSMASSHSHSLPPRPNSPSQNTVIQPLIQSWNQYTHHPYNHAFYPLQQNHQVHSQPHQDNSETNIPTPTLAPVAPAPVQHPPNQQLYQPQQPLFQQTQPQSQHQYPLYPPYQYQSQIGLGVNSGVNYGMPSNNTWN